MSWQLFLLEREGSQDQSAQPTTARPKSGAAAVDWLETTQDVAINLGLINLTNTEAVACSKRTSVQVKPRSCHTRPWSSISTRSVLSTFDFLYADITMASAAVLVMRVDLSKFKINVEFKFFFSGFSIIYNALEKALVCGFPFHTHKLNIIQAKQFILRNSN